MSKHNSRQGTSGDGVDNRAGVQRDGAWTCPGNVWLRAHRSMNARAFVRPAHGQLVRHPDGRCLAAQGEAVVLTSYWRRRIGAGDVIVGPVPNPRSAEGPP
jgi:hypothetical protein